MRTQVRPTGQERTFSRDELIASKTDTRGHIVYANDVFLRLSAIDGVDAIGQPHNVIRHPEMPRGVFHLLWETISSGTELFAYINNLATDGANYWVLAHVTPTFAEDGRIVGYHSNRRLPERRAIDAIRPVYARMLQAEARQSRAVDAAQAGAQALSEELNDMGRTYDRFVWDLIDDKPMAGVR